MDTACEYDGFKKHKHLGKKKDESTIIFLSSALIWLSVDLSKSQVQKKIDNSLCV